MEQAPLIPKEGLLIAPQKKDFDLVFRKLE